MFSEFFNFLYSAFLCLIYLLSACTLLKLIAKNVSARRVEPVPVIKAEPVPVAVKIEVIDEAEAEDDLNGLGRMMSALCLEGAKEEKAGRDFSRRRRCVSEGFQGAYKFVSLETTKRNLYRAENELFYVLGCPDCDVDLTMFDEDGEHGDRLQVELELLGMREAMRTTGVGGNKH